MEGGVTTWSSCFRRNPRDWVLEPLAQLFDQLYAQKVYRNREDKVLWKGAKSIIFLSISYHRDLMKNNRPSFPWKAVWKTKVPWVSQALSRSFSSDGPYIGRERGIELGRLPPWVSAGSFGEKETAGYLRTRRRMLID